MENQINSLWRNVRVQRNSEVKLVAYPSMQFQRFSSKGSKRDLQVDNKQKCINFQTVKSKIKHANSFVKGVNSEKQMKITPRGLNLNKTGKISHKKRKTENLTDNLQTQINTQPQSKENMYEQYQELMKQMQSIYELFLSKLNKIMKNVKTAYQEQMAKMTMNNEINLEDKNALIALKVSTVKVGQLLSNSLQMFENSGLFGNEVKFVTPAFLKKFKSLDIDNKQFHKISSNLIERHSQEMKHERVLNSKLSNNIIELNSFQKFPSKKQIQNRQI